MSLAAFKLPTLFCSLGFCKSILTSWFPFCKSGYFSVISCVSSSSSTCEVLRSLVVVLKTSVLLLRALPGQSQLALWPSLSPCLNLTHVYLQSRVHSSELWPHKLSACSTLPRGTNTACSNLNSCYLPSHVRNLEVILDSSLFLTSLFNKEPDPLVLASLIFPRMRHISAPTAPTLVLPLSSFV